MAKGTKVAVHITIEDSDDRPERMTRDPDRYLADARRHPVHELMRQARPGIRPLLHRAR